MEFYFETLDSFFYFLKIEECKPKMVEEIYDFLGLKGFNEAIIEKMIASKINTHSERGTIKIDFPHWRDWSTNEFEKFDQITRSMMIRFKYT